jgi:hypothetical protein
VTSFDASAFVSAFAIEVDPEFPGDGDWGCPVVAFDRDGNVSPLIDSRWGTPFIARIEPQAGDAWVGMFAAGGLGGVRGAFATPNPLQLAVCVDGLLFLVDVDRAGEPASAVQQQITDVVACADPPLLLLVRHSDIVALGPTGVAWRTPRLCVDDLKIVSVTPGSVICSCDNLGGTPTIALDPATGAQIAGTRMASFWPPDALA